MSESIPRVNESNRPFGGRYVPESLFECLETLEEAFNLALLDAEFRQEFSLHLAALRPLSELQWAPRLSNLVGGAQIYLKREDENFTGSHSIINALGQALLAKRLNKTTIVAETGSGCHGVATAVVCEGLGLDCVIYMGAKDCRAQPSQVKSMQMHGAQVVEVSYGAGSIREAIAEVLRAAVADHETTYPLFGGAYGPRPLPSIASAFQSIIGAEVKAQSLLYTGCMPAALVASAGIHGPAVGLFESLVEHPEIRLIAAEAAGCGIVGESRAAVLTHGSPGVYHGASTLVLQDIHGQIEQVSSSAPDLCYPGASPLLAQWVTEGRIEPAAVNDDEAMICCAILFRAEGIECSTEDGHVVAAGIDAAAAMNNDQTIVICLGG